MRRKILYFVLAGLTGFYSICAGIGFGGWFIFGRKTIFGNEIADTNLQAFWLLPLCVFFNFFCRFCFKKFKEEEY